MASYVSTTSSDITTTDGEKALQEFSDLPIERGWLSEHIHQYKGFWYPTKALKGLTALENHPFKPKPTDIILASNPKSGTTWLKALLFAITNRATEPHHGSLLSSNPHELVPHLETYAAKHPMNPAPDSPLMNTHLAFNSLPGPNCRIVYVFRDPKDVLVSCWHFVQKLRPKTLPPISLPEAFEQFSKGHSSFGPFWDHVNGYYKASLEFPERVFFLRYEDLKSDTCFHVKRLAEFLGQPLVDEEVKRITELCSFENMSNLKVNKEGTQKGLLFVPTIENNVYFRKGEVSDSKNHLSKEMIEVLDHITNQNLDFELTKSGTTENP